MIDREASLREAYKTVTSVLGITQADNGYEVFNAAVLKAQAASSIIYKHPELGTEEIHTSSVISRQLAKILGEESVYVLVKQDVGPVGINSGGIKQRNFLPRWGRLDFKKDLSDSSEMGGVVAILEGNNPDGPIIFLMSDLDALPNGHTCGHNAHTAALLLDAHILKEYKEKTGNLPVNKIVFIGRINEEGVNPKKQFSDAHEMLNAGLLGIVGGNPDIILSAHVLPSLSKGEIIIDKGPTTHGAGFFSVVISAEKSFIPLEVLSSYIVCGVADEWKSESSRFASARLIATEAKGLNKVVRITDMNRDGNGNLNTSLLKNRVEVSLPVGSGQDEKIMEVWGNINKNPNANIEIFDNKIKIIMTAPGGHVAAGGINLEYIAANAIVEMDSAGVVWGESDSKKIEMVGTIRIKLKDWKKQGREVLATIKDIADRYSVQFGAEARVDGSVVVPPVINDAKLRDRAKKLIKGSFNNIFCFADKRLLASYAEPLSFWQRATGAKTLMVWVGNTDKKLIENSTYEVAEEMQLHNNKMAVDKNALPYLGILSLLAIDFAYTRNLDN